MAIIFVLRHGKTNHENKLNRSVYKNSIPKIINNLKKFTDIDNIKKIITSHRERCYQSGSMLSECTNIKLLVTEKLNRCDEDKRNCDIRIKEYADKIKKNVLKHSKEDKNYAVILITHSSVYRTLVKYLCMSKIPNDWLYFRALSVVKYDENKNNFYLKVYNYI